MILAILLGLVFGALFTIALQVRPLMYLTFGIAAIVGTVLTLSYLWREEKILMHGKDKDIINANVAILLRKGYTKAQAIQIAKAFAQKSSKVRKK